MIQRLGISSLFVASLLGLGADWPRFRGPDGSGISAETGLPIQWGLEKNLAWKLDLPGPGSSGPVFLGDRIYLTCYTGYNVPGRTPGEPSDLKRHLLALDRKSGKILWNQMVDARLPEQSKIRDSHGYATSTPAVDQDGIYCFFGKSGVFAFDHSGKKIWQTDVGDGLNGWGSAASPILYEDLLIINASVESQSLIALDRKTGKEKWKAPGIKESWSTPILVTPKQGKPELVLPIQGKILGFDPSTGEQLWNCRTDISWYMVPSLVASDGVVYSLGGRSGIAALAVRAGGKGEVTSSHRLWTSTKGSNVSSPVIHGGHLYWINDSTGVAFCAKAETGEIVYEQRVDRGGQVYASSLLADGRIHYVTREGRTFVLPAEPRYELLASNDLRDRSLFHATPVAVDGRIFIRSDKAFYCLEKK